MALSIQLSSDFDPSAVCFSNLRKNKSGGKAVYLNDPEKRKIYIQLPYMRAPFGLSSYTDDATKKTSYSLDLSFDGEADTQDLEEKLKNLDDYIVETVAENSQEWLGKKYKADVLRETLYTPLVRPGKDAYPSKMKLKILTDLKTGNFIPEAYNFQREQVELDSIEKGQKVMCIIDLNQIWIVGNKFGVSMRLQQVLLEPSKKLPSFAFQGVSEEVYVDEEDEVDM